MSWRLLVASLLAPACAAQPAWPPPPPNGEWDRAGVARGRIEAAKDDVAIVSTPEGLVVLQVEWACLRHVSGDEVRFLDVLTRAANVRVAAPRTGQVCTALQLEQAPLPPFPLARTEADVLAIGEGGAAALLTAAGPKVASVREGCSDLRPSDRLQFHDRDLPESCINARVTVARTGEACELWCG